MELATKGSDQTQHEHADFDRACLIFVRISLLALAFLSASVFSLYAQALSENPELLTGSIALLLSFTVLNAYWILSKRSGYRVTLIQLAVDAIYVTILIYLTGGGASPFHFFYLALIMSAAILSSRRTALVVAAISFALYESLLLSHEFQLIHIPGNLDAQLSLTEILLQGAGLCSAMILIAVAASYLRENIRRTIILAQSTEEELQSARERQQTLVNQIMDGLITSDLDDKVVSINETARSILSLNNNDFEQTSMKDLLSSGRLQFPHGTPIKEYEHKEIDTVDDEGQRQLIHVSRKQILDAHGSCTGSLYLIQDVTRLRSIEKQLAMQEEMARLLSDERGMEAQEHSFQGFIGQSPVMKAVFNLIERVARSDASVLVIGESGTGKELVARSIHHASDRVDKPFIALNCGAIPENLIESELFGHKKGSFTGADADRTGLFLEANGGTLFLDEIGELPLHMQSKLLRAIQEKKIRPVGGDREFDVDVRILSATNRNLREESQNGNFREDLYFRLNVIGINLPPLRKRKEDLPLLIDSILKKMIPTGAATIIAPKAMQLLTAYSYPGNVRELENILERAIVLGGEVILPEHLPDAVLHGEAVNGTAAHFHGTETLILEHDNLSLPIELDDVLTDIEKRYLLEALKQTNGAKKKAAELLGINFRSFRYRLRKFQIDADEGDNAES